MTKRDPDISQEERECIEATEELLCIPGFLERFREAERQAAKGETVPLSTLQAIAKRSDRHNQSV